ncbi:hypothetical protein ACFFGH_02315 [Lysobacter korlensis]|uniref:Uncharacterized protein n=1 Tax=Lysobacter korlensis TaxID=553636 RepID=A0ABV6RL39_9GAMM
MTSPVLRRPVAIALSLVFAAAQTFSTAAAAEVVVDGPHYVALPIYAPQANRTSLVQTFRAEDPRIRFGFEFGVFHGDNPELFDPFGGVTLVYRLYEGDTSLKRLIATRYVAMPHEFVDSEDASSNVGFVEADFSQVRLKVGRQYSMQVTRDPKPNVHIGVWAAEGSPYAHGIGYNPPDEDPNTPREFDADFDAYFRMTPVTTTPCARTRALRSRISSAPGISAQDRKRLNAKLTESLVKPYLPSYQKTACTQLDSFIKYVDQHSHRFNDATAVYLFDRADLIRKSIPCR